MLQTLKMMRKLLYLLLLLLVLLLLLLQLFLKLQNDLLLLLQFLKPLIALLLLLLLQLLQLPLNTPHHLDDRVFASRAAFRSAPIRKRQQHVLGVIGQRALHKHDALESGLDAGSLQPLHALPHKDARFVNGKNGREKGEDVADDDARLSKIRVALELVRVEG